MANKLFIKLLFTIIVLSHIGCSAKYHAKRAKHHHDKAIQKGHTIQTDTVYIPDTIIVPSIRIDTFFHVKEARDTITITRDNIITKLLWKHDSIYLESECLADTIYRDIPVTVQETLYIEKSLLETIGIDTKFKKYLFWSFLIIIIIIAIMLIILKFLRKFF